MSQNYYGGGGGGYMVDSPGYGSQNSPGGAAKRTSGHSIRPITSMMLGRAEQAHTDAEWMLDGIEIAAVTTIAHIISVTKTETLCIYALEDGWGRFEARRWVDTNTEEDNLKWNFDDSDLVRVTGVMKTFGSKKYLNAQHMRKITDHHEIYYHHLEVAFVQVALERGHPNASKAQGDHPAASSNGASAYSAQSHNASGSGQYAHLAPLERRIAEFLLQAGPSAEGIHVGAIARSVGGTAVEISDALDKLMDDGHVYTTINESHFALSL